MPQLSDSMDEGKLISWKKKVGDIVHIGDVIAEVESDKAIMEVQCFKNGSIKSILISEGVSAPVGTLIAEISLKNVLEEETLDLKQELKEEKEKEEDIKVEKYIQKSYFSDKLYASPKARIYANEHNIDIYKLQKQNKIPVPTHLKDILDTNEVDNKYFTHKALKLMQTHKIEAKDFNLDKKYDTNDILNFIQKYNIKPLREIPSFQKALIKNLEKSRKKAVYHIYDYIYSSYFKKYNTYGITTWLIKIFAKAMMEFDAFRSGIQGEYIYTRANANIALAMAENNRLYMPVFKDVNLVNINSIEETLIKYKNKVQKNSLSIDEMSGSSFAISNLGGMGIHRFDAMINQDDSAIAAIGAEVDEKISITLSIDHRLVNGYEASLFLQKIKDICLDEDFFKDTVKEVRHV